MKRKFPPLAAALVAALLGGSAFAQSEGAAAKEAEDPAMAKVNALLEEYRVAFREWRDSAKSEEDPNPETNPARIFAPKFEALAGTLTGKPALAAWGHSIGSFVMIEDETATETAFGKALAACGNEDEFVPLLYYVSQTRKAPALFERAFATSTNVQVKAASKFIPAEILWDNGEAKGEDLKKARAGLEEVARQWPDTRFGKTAKGSLYEADHLQLGMKAPDIPIVTPDGKESRLADYRGKNLLLYFWATW